MKKIIIVSIITISLIIGLTYMLIGNPVVFVNNYNLQKEVTTLYTEDVTLNEIVPFEWDIVYTFDPYTSKEEIEKIIGFKSYSIKESVSEGMLQLLFVKDSKVVSSVSSHIDTLDYSINFSGSILYTDYAVFSVERDSDIVILTYKN